MRSGRSYTARVVIQKCSMDMLKLFETRAAPSICRSAPAGLILSGLALLLVIPGSAGAEQPANMPGARVADPKVTPPETWTPTGVVNRALPSWVRLGGEYRLRFEGRTAFGFVRGADDGYLLSRLRLNLDLAAKPWLHFFVEGQDSRPLGIDARHVNPGLKDNFDFRQCYFDFRARQGDHVGWFNLRVGRQELRLGGERLVGVRDWGVSRTFDGVKLSLTSPGARADIFAASPVVIDMAHFDKRRPGQNLHGAYGTLNKLIPHVTIEPYFLWATLPHVHGKDGVGGNADVYTAGARVLGKLPRGFDYTVEMARQTGHMAQSDILAWGGYGIVGYTLAAAALKPRFSVEYGYASGDRGSADGTFRTFDQLYPTNHGVYGLTDRAGWRNLRHFRGGVEVKPHPNLAFKFEYHTLALANLHDGFYASRRTPLIHAPKGGAQHGDVGQEADVLAEYTLRNEIILGAGVGHLYPGRFLKENSPGGGTSYPYIYCSYRF